MKCPHANIQYCPLYVASHDADGLGCITSGDGEFVCMVEQGTLDHADALGKLMAHDARMVETVRWNEQITNQTAQRKRNLSALGLN